jgi:hypothetical protein
MEDNHNQTSLPESLGGESDGGGSVSDVSIAAAISKATGKSFTSDEQALKSVADTFKYVGAKIDAAKPVEKIVEAPVDTSKFVSREQYETDTFFANNPDLKQFQPVLSALKSQNPDKSFDDLIGMDSVKPIIEKASAYDKQEKTRSVLQSNPRLGAVSDKITQARAEGVSHAEGSRLVTEAVLDAFEIK